jgi:hypothetical protein
MRKIGLFLLTSFLWTFAIAQEDSAYYDMEELEHVTLSELYTVDMLQVGDSFIYLESPHPVHDYVVFELITKQEYESAFYSKANQLIPAPQFGREVGVNVQLFCDNGVLNLQGNDDDSESHVEYAYHGYYPALNALLVQASGYEDYRYVLIDKHTGAELSSFENVPKLSNDYSVLACVNTSPYTVASTITFVKQGDYQHGVWMSFPQWTTSYDADSLFWGNDGQFYFPVIRSFDRYNESGSLRAFTEFARFRLATTDDVAISNMLYDFYTWHFDLRQYGDFMPLESSVVNEKYTSLDWAYIEQAEQEMAATGFFTQSFLSEHHRRAVDINAGLQSGRLEYFVGDIPPYYSDFDPWCNCQDYSSDYLANMSVRLVSINGFETQVEWSWDDQNWYGITLQRYGNEWRINKMSGF